MRLNFGIIALGAFFFGAACADKAVAPEPVDAPNVLLISIDTLRADSLGCYGSERPTTPFLDQFAAKGVLFENAIVNSHSTGTSHTTMLSGLYQETHKVQHDVYAYSSGEGWTIPDSVALLPEMLRDNGYLTIGVTEAGYVGEEFGFSRGFERFEDDQPRDIRESVKELLSQLHEAQPDDRPAFLFLHTYQPHAFYRSPPHYQEIFGNPALPGEGDISQRVKLLVVDRMNRAGDIDKQTLKSLRLLYDAAVRYTDDSLRQLFSELEETGFLDDALVIITSDHGEEFGEHGGLQHRGVLFEELIRVPLLMRVAGGPTGQRRSELVATVDIAPTILSYCGLEPPDNMLGFDLLAGKPDRAFVFTQYGNIAHAVRGPRWKFIEAVPLHESVPLTHPKKRILFDLEQDPAEHRNVVDEHPEIAERLEMRMAQFRESLQTGEDAPGRALSNEELQRLRSLGYLQ